MTPPNSADPEFLQLIKQGWRAGYPPWFWKFLIKPANCKTDEEASRLLNFLRTIEDGKPEEARRLLPVIDPNLRLAVEANRTESLLEWAVEKAQHPDCIRLLVDAGASLKAPNLAYKLVTAGRTDLLNELIADGVDPKRGNSALISACWDDPKAVRTLLNAGASIDVTTTVYITNSKAVSKVTPVMVAAYAGQLETVKLLVDAGADVNALDAKGNTAVTWAKISRAKAKVAKIVSLLEKAGALTAGSLPEPVDFTARAKSPEYQEAIRIAKTMTKSPAKPVQLAEGPLPGARAFRLHGSESSVSFLDDIRPKVDALGAFVFLSDNLYESSVPYLVIVPTTDYREAIIAFETPQGQSIDSYELIAWLTELEKTQPFVITHLAPDLIRARFTTPIQNAKRVAKAIKAICPDVVDSSVSEVAKHLEKSQELCLWWD